MRISIIFFASAFVASTLGGCDALTSSEKLAQQDDAFCQSLGTPGTKEYDRCRVNREEARGSERKRESAATLSGPTWLRHAWLLRPRRQPPASDYVLGVFYSMPESFPG